MNSNHSEHSEDVRKIPGLDWRHAETEWIRIPTSEVVLPSSFLQYPPSLHPTPLGSSEAQAENLEAHPEWALLPKQVVHTKVGMTQQMWFVIPRLCLQKVGGEYFEQYTWNVCVTVETQ